MFIDRTPSSRRLTRYSVLGAILAPIAAVVIQLAISRRREYVADASGAELTRYPQGLASALRTISANQKPSLHLSNPSIAHLMIAPQLGATGKVSKLFSTGALFDPYGPHSRLIGVRRSILDLVGTPEESWSILPHGTVHYVIVPNALLVHQLDHFELWRVFPLGVDRSVIYTGLYAPSPPDDERADAQALDGRRSRGEEPVRHARSGAVDVRPVDRGLDFERMTRASP